MATTLFGRECRHPEPWQVFLLIAAVYFVSSLGVLTIVEGRFEVIDVWIVLIQSTVTFFVALTLEELIEHDTQFQRVALTIIAATIIEAFMLVVEEGKFTPKMAGPLMASVFANFIAILLLFELFGWCLSELEA